MGIENLPHVVRYLGLQAVVQDRKDGDGPRLIYAEGAEETPTVAEVMESEALWQSHDAAEKAAKEKDDRQAERKAGFRRDLDLEGITEVGVVIATDAKKGVRLDYIAVAEGRFEAGQVSCRLGSAVTLATGDLALQVTHRGEVILRQLTGPRSWDVAGELWLV